MDFFQELSTFISQLLIGLTTGSLYALIALGYTMVYGVLKLINFAHGELFALGAFLGLPILATYALEKQVGLIGGILILTIIVFFLVAIIGVGLERIAYRPLRQAPRLSAVVSALGASIFFQNAISIYFEGKPQAFPLNFPVTFTSILDLKISIKVLIVLPTALILMTALYYFIQKTKIGTAIRAAAINQKAAKLMGINVNRIIMIVFIIGPGLGGIAGLIYAIFYRQINFDIGWMFGLKAFTAAIIGGIGNIPGAMLGGLLLGVLEALFAYYISGAWTNGITFFVLVILLLIRPTGLLGEKVAEKL